MQPLTEKKPTDFVDRRVVPTDEPASHSNRRQFSNSHGSERPEVVEIAEAIDRYKLLHRRRFITFEELYEVLAALGYHK